MVHLESVYDVSTTDDDVAVTSRYVVYDISTTDDDVAVTSWYVVLPER